MQFPGSKPEYSVVESQSPMEAQMGYWGHDTKRPAHILEQMNFLYVSVVEAQHHSVMELTGSLNMYVEVHVSNYRGITRHLERNLDPILKSVFAFANERWWLILKANSCAAQYWQTAFPNYIVAKFCTDFDVQDNDGRSLLHWFPHNSPPH